MVIVLVHLVIIDALGSADGVTRHSCQDDVHKLNVIGTHEEVEKGAVHAGATARAISVDFTEELVDIPVHALLEDGLLNSHKAHDYACCDAGDVVDVEPAKQNITVARVADQLLVGDVVSLNCCGEKDVVGEAEVW